MNGSLKPDVQKLIDERVNSGKDSSAEAVVEAAILALEQLEHFGDFEAGELDALLAEGENGIGQNGMVDGEDAYRMRVQHRAESRSPQ